MYYNLPQRTEILHVDGKAGALQIPMYPNSEALFVDEKEPIVWFVKTDNTCNKTVFPYTITPYVEPEPIDINSLTERIARLEARLNESNIPSNENE